MRRITHRLNSSTAHLMIARPTNATAPQAASVAQMENTIFTDSPVLGVVPNSPQPGVVFAACLLCRAFQHDQPASFSKCMLNARIVHTQ
jgi:hypothetical protein